MNEFNINVYVVLMLITSYSFVVESFKNPSVH